MESFRQAVPVVVVGAVLACVFPPLYVPFETVAKDWGSDDAGMVVIRSQSEWQRRYGHQPTPANLNVDFARDEIVVVGLGRRPNTSYGIRVDSVSRAGLMFRTVDVTEYHVIGLAFMAETHPTAIIKAPRSFSAYRMRKRFVQREIDPGRPLSAFFARGSLNQNLWPASCVSRRG